ncbi:MAG: S26 family signal peptidase [Nanoarchaeota archaeon]
MNNILKNLKRFWNWVWNSDSFLSWIVSLVLIFIFVKLIFFPFLSVLFGTSLPLAGVESSSMDHKIINDGYGYNLCGKNYDKKEYINFNEYWEICGKWYESHNLTQEEFGKFNLKNGFSKGDIIIVWGRFDPEVGDVIIFEAKGSSAPRPIIHRIVGINENIISTKGDHNAEQLRKGNNIFNTDETNINKDQVIGKAIIKIPYLGWPKIWLVEFLRYIFN